MLAALREAAILQALLQRRSSVPQAHHVQASWQSTITAMATMLLAGASVQPAARPQQYVVALSSNC